MLLHSDGGTTLTHVVLKVCAIPYNLKQKQNVQVSE